MNPRNLAPVAAVVATPGALAALAPILPPLIIGAAIGTALLWLFSSDEAKVATVVETAPHLDVASEPVAELDAPEGSDPVAEPSLGRPATSERPSCQRSRRVNRADIEAVLRSGAVPRGVAVAALQRHVGCGRTAAYRALAPGSKLVAGIAEDGEGRLVLA